MKIDVLCTREHSFQGSGGSEKTHISRRCLEGVESEPWEATVGDFCDFWASTGSQKDSNFEEMYAFFEVWNFDDFGGKWIHPRGLG